MKKIDNNLLPFYKADCIEAGCDEAGRGCLAGPVFAAAVVLSADFECPHLNDSKQLTEKQRQNIRLVIEQNALAWAVARIDAEEIDNINILKASILCMHKALDRDVAYKTIVKGDGKYLSIAAASVLAKTHRDDYMSYLHSQYPHYQWNINKGYPTPKHRQAIKEFGISPYHRRSFKLLDTQTSINFDC